MSLQNTFTPGVLAQTTCSVNASSQFFAIPATNGGTGQFAQGGDSIELYNAGPAIVFYESCGGSNGIIAATVANSAVVGVGQCKINGMHPGDTGVSIIGASAGPSTVYVTRGSGA
jgi:hypothetical protein